MAPTGRGPFNCNHTIVKTRATLRLAIWIGIVGISPQIVMGLYALGGPAFQATFHLPYDLMGLLGPASVFGYGIAALVGGALLDRVRVAPLARVVLLLAMGACVVGGVTPWWILLAVTMVVFGESSGILNILPMVFFSDLYPEDRTRTMARWQLVVSIASVIMPLIIGVLLGAAASHFGEQHGWRVILLGCAPVFIILLALMPRQHLGRRTGVEPFRLKQVIPLVRSPMFVSILILGVLHTAADNSAYFWIILMVKQRFHVSPEMTGVLASAPGVAYVSGRFLRSTLRWPLRPLPNIALGSLVGAAILLAAVRAPTFPTVVVLYGAAALFISLNWPSTLGFAGDRFPTQTGTVLGAVNAVSGPGTALVSIAMGIVSRHSHSVAAGMLIPPAMFFALSVFAWITHLRSRRLREPTAVVPTSEEGGGDL